MKIIIGLAFLFLCLAARADELVDDAQEHELNTETKKLSCDTFELKLITKEFSRNLAESEIPTHLTMKHYGNPYLVSQQVLVDESTAVDVNTLLPEYERIESGRKYSAKFGSCVGGDSFTLSLWGGGNCRTVCEAWALVSISEGGTLLSSKGLSYAEFKTFAK